MAQLAGFPKELNHHFTDSIDRLFMTTMLVTSLVFFPLLFYLQSLPPKDLTDEQLKKYLQVIYKVEPEKQIVKKVEKKTAAKARKVEATEVVQQTVEQKKERRKTQRAAREARRAKAQAAARSTGIFAAAGALSSGRGGGGSGRAGKTLGGGGLGGVNVGNLSGLATGTDIGKVEKLRGGGAITEGAGDIDVTQL
ncbi:MAG TPA: hypothetical protein ENI92_09980, partial [Bacteroidetes bacterium]|nr:hypothetical protein [Bacteroidota bacterium]